MSRPAVFNAFDEAMIAELDAAFAAARPTTPAVRVIVLAGAGRHFSAGADLQWMQRASTAIARVEPGRCAALRRPCWRASRPARSRRVARVQGAALGGGVGLACACDIAIAADDASFSVSEARFGILPAVIGPYVTNAVGRRQARRLALTTDAHRRGRGAGHRPGAAGGGPDALDAAVDATAGANCWPAARRRSARSSSSSRNSRSGPITPEVRELTRADHRPRARQRRGARGLRRLPGQAARRTGFRDEPLALEALRCSWSAPASWAPASRRWRRRPATRAAVRHPRRRRGRRPRASWRPRSTAWSPRASSTADGGAGRAGAHRAGRVAAARPRDARLVVEAIVENLDAKRALFAAAGRRSSPPTRVLATNTSSISVTAIANGLQRPAAAGRHALLQPGAADEAGGGGVAACRPTPAVADGRLRPGQRLGQGAGACALARRASSSTASRGPTTPRRWRCCRSRPPRRRCSTPACAARASAWGRAS